MIKYINNLQVIIKNYTTIFINYIYKVYIDWIKLWWITFLLIVHYISINTAIAEWLGFYAWTIWFFFYWIISEEIKFKNLFMFLWLSLFITNYLYNDNILYFDNIAFASICYFSLFWYPLFIHYIYKNLKTILNKITHFLRTIKINIYNFFKEIYNKIFNTTKKWMEYIYLVIINIIFYILKFMYLVFLLLFPLIFIIENSALYLIILLVYSVVFYSFFEKRLYWFIDTFFNKLFKNDLLKNKNEYLNEQYDINKDYQEVTTKMADISWKLFLHWNRDKILDKSDRENLKKEYDELSVQEIKLKRILKEIKIKVLKINILNFLKSKRKYFLLLLYLTTYIINMIIYL